MDDSKAFRNSLLMVRADSLLTEIEKALLERIEVLEERLHATEFRAIETEKWFCINIARLSKMIRHLSLSSCFQNGNI